jgi:hypothetical protein
MTPKYQVPSVIHSPSNWATVRMERKDGVRVHDFVATVNELAWIPMPMY